MKPGAHPDFFRQHGDRRAFLGGRPRPGQSATRASSQQGAGPDSEAPLTRKPLMSLRIGVSCWPPWAGMRCSTSAAHTDVAFDRRLGAGDTGCLYAGGDGSSAAQAVLRFTPGRQPGIGQMQRSAPAADPAPRAGGKRTETKRTRGPARPPCSPSDVKAGERGRIKNCGPAAPTGMRARAGPLARGSTAVRVGLAWVPSCHGRARAFRSSRCRTAR